MVEVRLYENKDLNSVNNILSEAFNIRKDNFHYDNMVEIVAFIYVEVCGYLLLTKILNPILNRYYYSVDYVCVLSKYRNIGIGRKMMLQAEMIARREKAVYLQLTCSTFRRSAHKLYEACGYIKRDSDIFRRMLE